MKYRKNTVRKNLTLTEYSANTLDKMTKYLPLSQSQIIDKLMSSRKAILLSAFTTSENGETYNQNALTGVIDQLIAFGDKTGSEKLRKIQDMIPSILPVLKITEYDTKEESGETCHYIAHNIPTRLLENTTIKELHDNCANGILVPGIESCENKIARIHNFIIGLNLNIVRADNKIKFTDIELSSIMSAFSGILETVTFVPYENYAILFEILDNNSIFNI